MRITRRFCQGIVAGLLLFGATSESRACFYTADVEMLGKPLTPRQERAEARRIEMRIAAATRAETVRRLQISDARLAKGPVDFAGELAEWLVPNVRAVPIRYSDCGGASEVDYAKGSETDEAATERFLGGTRYSGIGVPLRWLAVRGVDAFSFGRECNAEFRRRFAATLVASVGEDDLRDAWRHLGARLRPSYARGGLPDGGNDYERLVAFGAGARVPPLQWVLPHAILSGEVARYVRTARAGRAVDAAAARFWANNAASLGDDMRVCPATVARVQAARAGIETLVAERWPNIPKD
jgi:hypothetical protein